MVELIWTNEWKKIKLKQKQNVSGMKLMNGVFSCFVG